MGPKTQIQPEDLAKYERAGVWIAEEKHDGHWAEVMTGNDGRITRLTSRSGTMFSGSNVEGLIGTQTSMPNSVLIAELESGTEAANKKNASLGHRRLHVFDVVKLFDQSTTTLVYEQRRALLERAFSSVLAGSKKLLLTRQVTSGFEKFFNDVTELYPLQICCANKENCPLSIRILFVERIRTNLLDCRRNTNVSQHGAL